MTSLAGRIALVTGASRGIGRAIALAIARKGAHVVVHYRGEAEKAEETVRAVQALGVDAFPIQADLGRPDGASQLIARLDAVLSERYGSHHFDILVNNAGAGSRAVIEEVTDEELERTLQIDFKSPFALIRQASPRLRDGGRVVNVSSMGTRAAYPAMAAYAPAKAALEALTLLLAPHFGPRGITVNAVMPGATATDMHPGAKDPVQSLEIAKSIALGRVGQPEDVADVVAFLASDEGRWVTGQVIDASGGQRL